MRTIHPLLRGRHLLFVLLLIYTTAPAQTAFGDPEAVPVEFRFNYSLTPADSGAGLNGSMNGWLGGVYKMKQYQPNWWRVTLELLPLTYEYKFVTYTDTVAQNGVTAYFTDPLNPFAGGPFNNSFMKVRSPMIYYLLPKTGTSVQNDRPLITAKLAVANKHRLNTNKIYAWMDGAPIPSAGQYYDSLTRSFNYTPALGLSYSQHTFALRIFTTSGDSADLSTQFTVTSFFAVGPYTFQFDSKSPSFQFLKSITRVDVKGDFNSGGNSPMSDPDSDGVYTFTTNLDVNKQNEYTVIINSGLYINDPDNPLLSGNHRTVAIKRIQRVPEFRLMSPASEQMYSYPADSVSVSATVFKSDSSIVLLTDSLRATYDGAPLAVRYDPAGGGAMKLSAAVQNPSPGRHVITFYACDFKKNVARPVTFTFGVKNTPNEFYAVDNDEDDYGAGGYLYPVNTTERACDIEEMRISATANNDSLRFSIKMKALADITRLGLFVTNALDNTYANAFQDVELKIPEWNGRGIYLILAKPGTPGFNPDTENKLYISRDPLQTGATIQLDNAALSAGIFRFTLPLQTLENILGSYNEKWNFGAFSYLRNTAGTVEIGAGLGGSDDIEDADVYDILGTPDKKIQERLLANYNSPAQTGGLRIATVGTNLRGSLGVLPTAINTALGQAPKVRIYADGGDLLTDTVRVSGFADLAPGTTVTLRVNASTAAAQTNPSRIFSSLITLQEGSNKITAEVQSGGVTYRSAPVSYTYIKDHNPVAKIASSAGGGTVQLDGSGSTDPDGGQLTYLWAQDASNPQQLTFPAAQQVISFAFPAKKGEYYFTLTVTDNTNRKGWARAVVAVTDSGTVIPDLRTFHSRWIDTALVYNVFVRTYDAAGTFNAVAARMQEIRNLGADCIWFLPIHPTTFDLSADNPGYATTNYLDVLSNYGTKEEFRAMVQKAHQYGIRVILDHVIQHTSALHPFMRDANKYKSYSPYYPFYYWDANNNYQYLFTWVDLPSINYGNAATRDYLLRAAKYWMQEFDVDGYRCDVAWAINDMRPEGPAYWQKFRSELKGMKPDAFLLAEADAVFPRYFDAKFDAAYDWEWFRSVRSIISGTSTIAALDSVIQMYYKPSYPKHAVPFKFLENQDEQRFIEAFGPANTKLAAVFMYACPGTPMLYAGQEVGEITFRGVINWNDPHDLLPYYKQLHSIRSTARALNNGDFTRVPNSTPFQVYSFLRARDTSNAISVFNFSEDSLSCVLNVPLGRIAFDSSAAFFLNDVLNGQSYPVTGAQLKNYEVSMPGKSARIFILSKTPLTAAAPEEGTVPTSFVLSQNYPNPFNPSTTVKYSLPQNSRVSLAVYNALGELVARLVSREENAGTHSAVFNAAKYASGIYFLKLEARPLSGAAPFISVRKMILMK